MCTTHALITAHFLNKCGLGLYRINYKLTVATLFFVAFGGSDNESALADAWMLARKKRQKQAFLLRRKSSTPRHHQPEYTAWLAFRSPLKSATAYFETVMAQVAFVQDEAVWETFGKCGRWSIRVLCTQEKTGSNSVFVSSSIINVFWRTDRGHCTRSRDDWNACETDTFDNHLNVAALANFQALAPLSRSPKTWSGNRICVREWWHGRLPASSNWPQLRGTEFKNHCRTPPLSERKLHERAR